MAQQVSGFSRSVIQKHGLIIGADGICRLQAPGFRLRENLSEKLFPKPVVWSPKPISECARVYTNR